MKDTAAHSTILYLLDRSVESDWSLPIRLRGRDRQWRTIGGCANVLPGHRGCGVVDAESSGFPTLSDRQLREYPFPSQSAAPLGKTVQT